MLNPNEMQLPDLDQAVVSTEEIFKKPGDPIPERNLSFRHSRDDFNTYLFRASSFGRLMTGVPKALSPNQEEAFKAYEKRFLGEGKPLTDKQTETFYSLGAKKRASVKLTDGAKTFCEDLVRENVYARQKTIESKYLDKGIWQEQESIEAYSQFIGEDLEKNEERKQNDFWTGICDNYSPGIVRDFKTAWDFNTFPIAAEDIKNALYDWQTQVYMDLWGVEKAELIYCLVDTVFKLIEDEIRRLDWKYDILTVEGSVRDQHIDFVVEKVCNMIYTEEGLYNFCEQSGSVHIEWFSGIFKPLPIEKRIKVFKTEYNPQMIKWGKDMIALAREYMNGRMREVN